MSTQNNHIQCELEFSLEMAHYMTNVPKDHINAQIHGHSYVGKIILSGPIDQGTGYLVDYDELKQTIDKTVSDLDHRMMNDIEGLENPSSENLAKLIYEKMLPIFPNILQAVRIGRPTLGFSVEYSQK